MGLTGFLGRNATNHTGAVRDGLPHVESTLNVSGRISIASQNTRRATYSLSSESLTQDFGVLMNEKVLDGSLIVVSGRRL